MPNYLIDYFCFIAYLINMKLYASLPLSFVALSFSALEHIRKYPASFIKRQEHTQTLNGKDRAFFNTLTKTMDKNKGRPTRIVNQKVQN